MTQRRRAGMLLLIAAVAFVGCETAPRVGPTAGAQGKKAPMALANDYVRYVVGEDGKVQSFVDRKRRTDYLSAEGSKAFMIITRDGKSYASTSVAYDKGKGVLSVGFGDAGVSAQFAVRSRPHYFTFELTDVAGNDVESITLCQLTLGIEGPVGEFVGVARDTTFAAGVQAGNLKMEAGAGAKKGGALLYVKDSPRYGPLVGDKFALFGGPAKKALEIIGEIEVNEGLPHPMLAGKWNKVSPEATRSYLIIPYSEQNIGEVLKYAQAGGFAYIYHPGPFETWGHWPLNKREFPNGYAGLKAVVQKANEAGVKVGLHHLSGGITTNDAYVTPVPDLRLEKYGAAELAADVDAKATTLSVRDRKGRFGETKVVQVDEELVQYEDSSGENPVRLTGCVRGLYKTRPAAHKAGATVATLVINSYKGFVPEPNSTLLDEMAERMAGLFNDCGLSMISFDGWEWHSYRKGNYGRNKYLDAVFRRLKGEVIADASCMTHYGWHYFTRMNWGELTQSARVDVDEYRARNCQLFDRNLMPKALGWWRLGLAAKDWEATPLEEVEYLLAKAAGYNACHALAARLEDLQEYGLTEGALAAVKTWDGARYAGAFTDAQRERLRQRGRDFHLEEDGNWKWKLTPVRYSPSYWSRGGVSRGAADSLSFASEGPVRPGNYCEISNPYALQPLRFQLQALAAFDYDHKENVSLMPSSPKDLAREPGLHKEAPTIQVAAAEPLRQQPSLTLTARHDGDEPSYVTRLVYRLPKPLALAEYRGLGLWVRGDGKGELLFVELVDIGNHVRPYYIPIDFTGERYVELPNGEASLSRYYDYGWNNWSGFASWGVTLKGFGYDRVAAVTVGFNAIPARTQVSCAVGGIKALREIASPLVNPRFTYLWRTITFPVTLEAGQYLVCEGDGKGLVYDGNWHLLRTVAPEGQLLPIGLRAQTVSVDWTGANRACGAPWARVKLKLVGPSESVTPKTLFGAR